jgi:DNA-binding SARP family transcriptional activator
MATGCVIRLLGGFAVTVDGRPIPDAAWRHRRGADLVKLLALSPGHRLHREQAMDALWPDLSPDAAGANLRKATHFARRAMGSEAAIVLDGGSVALWPGGDVDVDVERFERAAIGSKPDSTAALSAYGGELLPGDPYASWTIERRDRLRLRYLELLRAAGDWQRVIDIDRSDEEAHRALMLAHLGTGNRQGVIKQFERLRTALHEDLGVAPDAASVDLYERALALSGSEPPTPAERARALLARGIVDWNRKDLDAAETRGREARALAIDAGLGHELGEASSLLALVAHARGVWREVFRNEFVASMDQRPDLASFVLDANMCFAEYSLHGPDGHEELAPFARELHTIAEGAGSTHGQAIATLMLGEVELLSGRVERAEEELTAAARLGEAAGSASAHSLSLERLGEAAIARGRRWKAGRLLTRARTLAEGSGLVSHLLVRVFGAMVKAAPDPARSRGVVEEAERALHKREVCESCSMDFRTSAAIASARSGDLERAKRHLDEAERIAGMWQGGPWRAAVWEARGALRRAEGDAAQASALFREAADLFATVKRPIDEARCRDAASALRVT